MLRRTCWQCYVQKSVLTQLIHDAHLGMSPFCWWLSMKRICSRSIRSLGGEESYHKGLETLSRMQQCAVRSWKWYVFVSETSSRFKRRQCQWCRESDLRYGYPIGCLHQSGEGLGYTRPADQIWVPNVLDEHLARVRRNLPSSLNHDASCTGDPIDLHGQRLFGDYFRRWYWE